MNTAPTTYAIRVNGHLDNHWSAWLGPLDITRDNDGTSTLAVSIADQAQLHGLSPACATSAPSSPNSAPPMRGSRRKEVISDRVGSEGPRGRDL